MEKLQVSDYFVEPILVFKRSMPIIALKPEMTEKGKNLIFELAQASEKKEKYFYIVQTLASELLQISMCLGFINVDYTIPSDKSIVAFNPKLTGKSSFSINNLDKNILRNKFLLRSQQEHIYLGDFCKLFIDFWKNNRNLFCPLINLDLPYGIIRVDSLFSFQRNEDLSFQSYLDFISKNLAERLSIFGLERYKKGINGSSHVIIDDEDKRNIYKTAGTIDTCLGELKIDGKNKKFYLSIRPGYADSCLGTDFVVTAENPNSSLFSISVQLMKWEGEFHPTITRFQVNPMQLDHNFNYVADFLPHSKTVHFNRVRKTINDFIVHCLGGEENENIFDILLACIIYYYKARGFEKIYGLGYKESYWINFHNPKMKPKKLKNLYYNLYNNRFQRAEFCKTMKDKIFSLILGCADISFYSLAKPIISKINYEKVSPKKTTPIEIYNKPFSENSGSYAKVSNSYP